MNRKACLLLFVFLLILCLWHFTQVKATVAELWRSAEHCLDALLGGDVPLIWKFVLTLLLVYSALLFFGIVGKHGNTPNWRGAMVPLIVFVLLVWVGRLLELISNGFEAIGRALDRLTVRQEDPLHDLAVLMVICITIAGCLRLLLQNRNK